MFASPKLGSDIARCAPGGCEYLVKNEAGQQVECGQPAEFVSGRGLKYCAAHAAIAADQCRRQRLNITFTTLGPQMTQMNADLKKMNKLFIYVICVICGWLLPES